jgi:hypothetical protein
LQDSTAALTCGFAATFPLDPELSVVVGAMVVVGAAAVVLCAGGALLAFLLLPPQPTARPQASAPIRRIWMDLVIARLSPVTEPNATLFDS